MNLNEINFSFGGLHCLRDFGCIYVEDGGHGITPPITRNEYEIAGLSGTILMDGARSGVMTFGGSLYFVNDAPSQAAAQEQLRRLAAWLTNGRQRLIFDYEPLRYYMASVNDAARWSYRGWIEGGLSLEFEAQPYAYAVRETTKSISTTATSAQIPLTMDTGLPAPLAVVIQNTNTAPITGVTVAVNGKQAIFGGLNLTQNTALTISMEPPIGAVFSGGGNALPYASRLDVLTVSAGPQTISVTLAYGGGSRGAQITARARGRWM